LFLERWGTLRKYFSFLLMIGLVLLAVNPAVAANKQGAKAYGMGGAFTAIADDASAVYWNPAGLTQNSLVGLQTSLGGQVDPDAIEDISNFIEKLEDLEGDKLDPSAIEDIKLPDNTEINVNGIAAVNLSKLGVGLIANNQFEFSGEKVIVNEEQEQPDEAEVPKGTATNLLTAQGIVGYGSELIDPPLVGSLSWGVSGKMLRGREDTAETTITDNDKVDVVYESATYTGVGADVGALMTISTPMIEILELKAGGTVKNIVSTLDSKYPGLERTSTVGLGAELDILKVLTARLAADLEMPENGENIQRLGAEGTLGLFSLRTGAYGPDLAESEGRIITYGAGFNVPFMDLNLAGDTDGYLSASGTFNF
jgi:hypothetical protein